MASRQVLSIRSFLHPTDRFGKSGRPGSTDRLVGPWLLNGFLRRINISPNRSLRQILGPMIEESHRRIVESPWIPPTYRCLLQQIASADLGVSDRRIASADCGLSSDPSVGRRAEFLRPRICSSSTRLASVYISLCHPIYHTVALAQVCGHHGEHNCSFSLARWRFDVGDDICGELVGRSATIQITPSKGWPTYV